MRRLTHLPEKYQCIFIISVCFLIFFGIVFANTKNIFIENNKKVVQSNQNESDLERKVPQNSPTANTSNSFEINLHNNDLVSIASDRMQTEADILLEIIWNDQNKENHAISFYYDRDNKGNDR